MAEFIGETENSTNIEKSVVFENKTDTAFEVSAGVVFHKSGIYEVSVLKNKTIVSKVTERERGEWISLDDFRGKYNEFGYKCSECGTQNDYQDNYCPHCGADMRGEEK